MKMTKLFSFILIAIVVLAAGTHSHAAPLVNVTGTWSFIMNGQGYTNQLFTGSTTFTYDKGIISGSGLEDIDNIPVTSFSMTPNPVGLTFFDTSNVQARVIFDNGLVTQTRLFGILGGGIWVRTTMTFTSKTSFNLLI